MKKFSKLNESQHSSYTSLLHNAGISKLEIKDICQDLIDEGYKLKVSEKFLSSDFSDYGNIKDHPNASPEFYPMIIIYLERDVEKSDDSRNWDGSIYYENSIDILNYIYHIIKSLKSLIDKDLKIYYSLQTINSINIRLIYPLKKNDLKLDINSIKNFINNIESFDIGDGYKITKGDYGDSENQFVIIPPTDISSNILKNMKDSNDDNVVKRNINSTDNEREICKKFDIIINEIYKFCKKNANVTLNHKESTSCEFTYESDISLDNIEIVKFSIHSEPYFEKKIIIDNSYFNKKIKKFTFYKLIFVTKVL